MMPVRNHLKNQGRFKNLRNFFVSKVYTAVVMRWTQCSKLPIFIGHSANSQTVMNFYNLPGRTRDNADCLRASHLSGTHLRFDKLFELFG